MVYFDIHTHHSPPNAQDVAIESIDILKPFSIQKGLYSIGIHPWHIDRNGLRILEKWASHPQIAAIGECGIDKFSTHALDLQKDIFILQAQIAENVQKPVIIHCVKAWQELIAVRKTLKPAMPWIIHGFRGNGQLAIELLRFGFFLSFGFYFQTSTLSAAWESNKLFAETDELDIDIRDVYTKISSELFVSEAELVKQINKNIQIGKHPIIRQTIDVQSNF